MSVQGLVSVQEEKPHVQFFLFFQVDGGEGGLPGLPGERGAAGPKGSKVSALSMPVFSQPMETSLPMHRAALGKFPPSPE